MPRDERTRRRILRTAGAALAGVSLAGCAGPQGGDGGNGGGTSTPGGDGTGAATETEQGTGAAGTEEGTGAATGTGTSTEAGGSGSAATVIRLDGKTAAWVGREPSDIAGKNNPTLTLQEGTQYELVWKNVDGVKHELIIENAGGDELVETESARNKGETRSVTFTAKKEMAEYYCEYHAESMRGKIEFGSGS